MYPVDLAVLRNVVQVAEGGAQGLSQIVVPGDQQIGQAQPFDLVTKGGIAFGTAIVRNISCHQHLIDGAELGQHRQSAVDRVFQDVQGLDLSA